MLFSTLPVSDMMVSNDDTLFSGTVAYAAGETYTFSYSDASDKKISLYVNTVYDSEENIVNNFKEYAHKYQTDSTFASNHKSDKISIAFTGANSDISIIGFEGIGTSNSPFEGSVEIPTGSNLVLNMDSPLFKVVYDTAKLYGSNTTDYARFSRFYNGPATDRTTPILAEEIRKNPDDSVLKGYFNVSLVPYTEGDLVYLKEFGGFTGTIGNNAIVTVKADITKDNAENGNAGGLVGSIGIGATLNYTQPNRTTPLIKSGTTISTSGSYAGGLVGENKGTVNITMPTERTVTVGVGEGATSKNIQYRYVIDQSISADTAAGGLYGYYSPASTTAEIETAIYDIDCDLSASDAAGGLTGIMESDHDVSIVRDTVYTDDYIQSEYVSGAGYYGGFIGKYKSLQSGSKIKTEFTDVRSHMSASNIVSDYGGVIGLADETNPNYIKVNSFMLENANGSNNCVNTDDSKAEVNFGGVVGSGKKSFIDASDITIKAGTASSRKYRGGGIVGDTLYNEEFEGSEAANGSTGYYVRTSHYDTSTIPESDPAASWNSYTQHSLMQNALFNNVTGTLTVGNVSLAGNVGIVKSGEGSGALVCGEFSGVSDTSLAVFTVSTSLVLDGINIYNFDSSSTSEYAPLIINKVTQNTDFYPEHIWATGSAYTSNNVTSKAATSLIGKVGSESAEHVVVSFKDIRLDGRSGSTPDLDSVYNTKCSIFTKATLLE